jgi:hypothetical protein
MKNYARDNRTWIIWITIFAVIFAGVGIFFYYTLFRQSKSELIEAIPTDASFIFTLNDNDAFVNSSAHLIPYLDELFVMDAMPAFETMRGKLPAGEYDLTVSGHYENEALKLLFNMHADKSAFRRLLRALSIDPNNYTSFENNRIYTYGTNFKSVKFVYLNHIISFSTDVELLKRAIVQHAHPKNLLSDKQFKAMYDLSEKNRKQNWLIINPKKYTAHLSSYLNESMSNQLSKCLENAGWTALQLRFSGNEMHLSGYTLLENTDNEDFELKIKKKSGEMEIVDRYPASVDCYTHLEIRNARDFKLKRLFDDKQTIRDLALSEIGYFTMHGDSTKYHYAILLPNSEKNALEIFYKDATKADSVRAAHPDGYFQTPQPLLPLLKALAPDSATWFVEADNALVFADSKEALTHYLNSLKATGTLTQNRLYPFVNEAVASSTLLNFVIFNEENNTFWTDHLSEKGKISRFGKNLRIFSLSCDAVEEDQHLVPVNLYLLF